MPNECYFREMLPHKNGQLTFLGTKHDQGVFRCPECGLVVSPKYSKEDYLKLYKSLGEYFKESVGVGFKDFGDRFAHDYEVSEVRWHNLKRHLRPDEKRVLDVGCGNCALMRRLKVEEMEPVGVDLDMWSLCQAAHMMKDMGSLNLVNTDFLDLPSNGAFDVVMFTDSFEHFLYPSSAAQHAVEHLKENGLIVIEMPDTDCDGFADQGINWRHVKPKEHPFLYTRHHVDALFKPFEMQVVTQISTIPGRSVYFLR